MQIRVGYDLIYECPQPTLMILILNIHYTRRSNIAIPDVMTHQPARTGYRISRRLRKLVHQSFGPQGSMRIATTGVVRDIGEPDRLRSLSAMVNGR
jgi:hypothetical protein